MPDSSNIVASNLPDDIPMVTSKSEHSIAPDGLESIRWHQNQFAKGIIENLPDIASIVNKPINYNSEEIDLWAELANNLTKPDFRRHLAESIINSDISLNKNNAAYATGLLLGAIVSPGSKKSFLSNLVPEHYENEYVKHMLEKAKSLPKNDFDPKTKPELKKTLNAVRPIDTGNPIRNFLLDHIPVTTSYPSLFLRRAQIEFDLGLIDGKEFADRTQAVQIMKAGIAGIAATGGYIAYTEHNASPPASLPSSPINNKTQIQAECADLLNKARMFAATKEYVN